MAILDFLSKQQKEIQKDNPEDYTPKSMPVRDAGGKFISKNKKIEEKEVNKSAKKKVVNKKNVLKKGIDKNKAVGPFMAPFAGKEVRKFYFNEKWYFSIQDLIFLLSADPPFPLLDQLKVKKEFKDSFKENLVVMNEIDLSEKIGAVEESDRYIKVDCADTAGSIIILRSIIKFYDASFPGSLFRWLEDISTFKFDK